MPKGANKVYFTACSALILHVSLRWLPRVITNIVLTERELENETYLISLKVFPRGDLPAWVLLK